MFSVFSFSRMVSVTLRMLTGAVALTFFLLGASATFAVAFAINLLFFFAKIRSIGWASKKERAFSMQPLSMIFVCNRLNVGSHSLFAGMVSFKKLFLIFRYWIIILN